MLLWYAGVVNLGPVGVGVSLESHHCHRRPFGAAQDKFGELVQTTTEIASGSAPWQRL